MGLYIIVKIFLCKINIRTHRVPVMSIIIIGEIMDNA